MDKEVNSLNGPQNAKDQEQFQVQDLKYRKFDNKCTKYLLATMVVLAPHLHMFDRVAHSPIRPAQMFGRICLQQHHHLTGVIENNFWSKFHLKSYFFVK